MKKVAHPSGFMPSWSAPSQSRTSTWVGAALPGFVAVFVAAACAVRRSILRARAEQQAASEDELTISRRSAVLPAAAMFVGASDSVTFPAFAVEVDVPDRINTDPYQLIGMENPDNDKADKAEFYMKKQYKSDTYQVLKHMKISGSLDKGTPNMEKWNKRIKEEMNDWVALYRRQEAVVGRQSYYSLYSAVNTLASHFTSYGPKFPFPSKRRPRFYELINTTEKYLEKGK